MTSVETLVVLPGATTPGDNAARTPEGDIMRHVPELDERWSEQRIVPTTINELLRRQNDENPDALCAAMGDQQSTNAEMWQAAERVARALRRLGAEPGARVALLLPNRFEWFQLFFGIARAGTTQVPLNPYLKGEFLRYQLLDCEPTVLIVDADGARAVAPYLAEVPELRAVVLLDGTGEPTAPDGVVVVALDDVEPDPRELPEVLPSDRASILYTSGTTGHPKGCVLSHGYYGRAGQIEQSLTNLGGDDVFFAAMPLFHGGAQLKVFMPCLVAGVPAVIEESFSPTRYLKRATETRGTIVNGVGAMGRMLLSTPASEHDRTHRIRVANIAPMSEADQEAFAERFGIDVWAESYGLTECVPVLGSPPAGPRDRGSCGIPARDLEVTLLDDVGAPVADGEVGEICFRPRHRFAMFDGYWKRSDATLEAFRGLWFHSGDYGMRRPSGAFSFVDRKKDSMRRRGENVSSIELEEAIVQYPMVSQVAVHAVKSDFGDDEIKACLILADSAQFSPSDFFAWLTDHVPYFAIPRYVEVLDELPQNHLGRIQKHVLRDAGITETTWDFESMGLTVSREDRR